MKWEEIRKAKSKLIRGWYAVNYCWEPIEGSFSEPLFFDGEKWPNWIQKFENDYYPILYVAGPFESENEAEGFIEKNDIEF